MSHHVLYTPDELLYQGGDLLPHRLEYDVPDNVMRVYEVFMLHASNLTPSERREMFELVKGLLSPARMVVMAASSRP